MTLIKGTQNMKRLIPISIIASIALFLMIGSLFFLTRIETGQVGVTRHFNGEYSKEPANVGLHLTVLDTIYKYSTREIPVQLKDLRPTAKDKINLEDLDFEIQYSVNPAKVPELAVKYATMSLYDNNTASYLPAIMLVDKQAKSVSADAVSKFDSLEINSKRVELENIIKENLQKDLNANDPDAFIVSRVSISNLKPDSNILDSIRRITESENRKLEAINNLEVAKTQAEENRIRSQTLDNKILAEKQLQTLEVMAKHGNLIVVPMDFRGMINISDNGNNNTTNNKPMATPQSTPATQ